jgi:hypothetical protein
MSEFIQNYGFFVLIGAVMCPATLATVVTVAAARTTTREPAAVAISADPVFGG